MIWARVRVERTAHLIVPIGQLPVRHSKRGKLPVILPLRGELAGELKQLRKPMDRRARRTFSANETYLNLRLYEDFRFVAAFCRICPFDVLVAHLILDRAAAPKRVTSRLCGRIQHIYQPMRRD